MDDWPFEDPPNLATFTVRQVVHGAKPILIVHHDSDDGSWQFLTGEPIDMADAMLVALQEIIRRDPSIIALADLPLGWRAWREHAASEWVREPSGPTDAEDQ